MPAQVWLLACIQALAMSAGATVVLVGGIVGASLAPDAALATLPVALMIVGTACGVIPITRFMQRWGRRPVFICAALFAALAACLAAATTLWQSFYGFLFSTFALGLSISAFQQIRFAAIESVPPDLAAKATARVLMGGLVAAVIGPELATLGEPWLAQPFAGSFVLVALVAVLCAFLFSRMTRIQVDKTAAAAAPPSSRHLFTTPRFVIAVATSVTGFALMSFIMTATPVHMHVHETFSLEETKWVIQSHILAMYLPSFISAWLVSRLGLKGVVLSGITIYMLTIFIGYIGMHFVEYWLALVLLGFGWNLLFLAGTLVLSQSHSVEQRFSAQGAHDFAVFAGQALAALSAGALLAIFKWQGLMQISLVIIVAYLLLLAWQYKRMRGQTHAA
ncbi:MFS transporter [Alteromonas facilis]|uniref:MFS transporter n=1 Tax=Alteromonas facilis TaxID=2048004 RepID=UPI001F0CCB7C|nr:MFS transporter [Alteromonas facilis]